MYGGAMVTGSSSNPGLQGNNFARKDVVFVSFNTRESIFAYPNSAELGKTGSQNFGILDAGGGVPTTTATPRRFPRTAPAASMP